MSGAGRKALLQGLCGIFGNTPPWPWPSPSHQCLPVQWCSTAEYILQLWVWDNQYIRYIYEICICLLFSFDVLPSSFLFFRGSCTDLLCEQVSCEHCHQQRPVHYSVWGSPRSHLFLFGFLASWLSQKEALHCSNYCCHPLHRVCTGKNAQSKGMRDSFADVENEHDIYIFFRWITSTKLLDLMHKLMDNL